METSHRDLAITETEWKAFMEDLQTTLDKFSVPAAEQAEVKALIESTHAAIVIV
jgi:hemoglobin